MDAYLPVFISFGLMLLFMAMRNALCPIDDPVTAEEDDAAERHLCAQDRLRRLRNNQLGNEHE